MHLLVCFVSFLALLSEESRARSAGLSHGEGTNKEG